MPDGLKDYLGDGVYALAEEGGIMLHTNDHENPTDRVFLEWNVLEALNRFAERVKQKDVADGTT